MPGHPDLPVYEITKFIDEFHHDYESWSCSYPPWFRGQPVDKPLIPKIYREDYQGPEENELVQRFRMRAPAFGKTPPYERIDEWLFLMQHSRLPTRLLDWTDGALIALFFSIYEMVEVDNPKDLCPVVWMLNPLIMNKHSNSIGKPRLPLSWTGHDLSDPCKPACPLNIKGAFEEGKVGSEFPVALLPQHVHKRVNTQRSCFTIHGKRREGIDELYKNDILIEEGYLKKYEISIALEDRENMLRELQLFGISYSTLFPDLDGLSEDLKISKK
jgi:hypothetical protein